MKTSRKNSKRRSREFEKIAKRLAAYSAAAAATVLTTGDRSANAAEVVHDVFPDFRTNNVSTGLSFNMVNGDTTYNVYGYYSWSAGKFRITADFGIGYIYGPAYSPLYSTDPNAVLDCEETGSQPETCGGPYRGVLAFIGKSYGPDADTYALGYPLSVSASIGGTVGGPAGDPNDFIVDGPFYKNYFVGMGDESWPIRSTNYIGIRFNLFNPNPFPNQDPNGRATHYGWAMVTKLRGSEGLSWILHAFGYNDTPDAPSIPTAFVNGVPNGIPLKDDIPFVADIANDDQIVNEDDWDTFKFWNQKNLDPNGTFDEDLAISRGDLSDPIDFASTIEDFARFKQEFEYYKSRLSLDETHEGQLVQPVSSVVPEPSAVLLLAAGATGLGLWRQRRRADVSSS